MKHRPGREISEHRLTQDVRARAADYFPELGRAVTTRLVRRDLRPASTLFFYSLSSPSGWREIVVKVPQSAGVEEPGPPCEGSDRPRLASVLRTRDKYNLEFQSLVRIQEHFEDLADCRFGAIRVLDLLPASQAVTMEVVRGSTLRERLHRAGTWTMEHERLALASAFENTGSWLREYQSISAEDAQTRHARRSDYIDFLFRVTEFLGSRAGDRALFEGTAATAEAAAARLLPSELPLGLGHGDFALRNVLVGPEERIIVLDTLGRYRVPVLEDIGFFLVSLRCNPLGILGVGRARGRARMKRFERAFLRGYFGADAIPEGELALYEVQALLDYWAAAIMRWRVDERGAQGVLHRLRLKLLEGILRDRLTDLLLKLSRSPEADPSLRPEPAR